MSTPSQTTPLTPLELETKVCEMLNADGALSAAGVRAFPQNAPDLVAEVDKALSGAAGAVIVVAAGDAERAADSAGSYEGAAGAVIPLTHSAFAVSCVELPAVNRARAGRLTAAAAVLRAVALLDCPAFLYTRHTVDADPEAATLTASAYFKTAAAITIPSAS